MPRLTGGFWLERDALSHHSENGDNNLREYKSVFVHPLSIE